MWWYPIPVASFGVWYVLVSSHFVFPLDFFENFGRHVPHYPQLILNTVAWIRKYILAVFIAAIVGSPLLSRIPLWRHARDVVALKMPVVGFLGRNISLSQFARAMGTSLRCGIPLSDVLLLAEAVVRNRAVSQEMDSLRGAVQEGIPIKEALENSDIFHSMGQMMGTIETSNESIAPAFLRLAEFHGQTAALAMKRTTKMIWLCILLFTVILILFNVYAYFVGWGLLFGGSVGDLI